MDEPRELRRIPLAWLLAPYAVMVVLSYVGDVVGPSLINESPLLQVFINPRNRWLLLASPQVDVIPFFVVGFIRLVLTDPIAYILGWQYGEAAISWIESKTGDEGGFIRKVERWFGKVAPLVILIAPSFNWCVLAGASRMRPRLFITLNVVGTLGRLALFRIAGEAFRDELEDVLELVQRYQWWLVALSFVVVALQVARKGGKPIETPEEMAAEIEAEEESLRDE